MLRIGLTGGIGSGKTSVSDLFANLGIPVIDTDVIARDLVDNDNNVLREISDTFGDDVVTPDGELDRQKLASIVFNSKDNKKLLENILHPRIEREVNDQLQRFASCQNPPDYAIIVVPLLIEANYFELIDRILVVVAEEEKRIERVRQRDNRSVSEIRAIINNQVSDRDRLKEADDIIENNNSIRSLDSHVAKLHDKYKRLSGALR
jgi:dephospho-CoA kinase